MKCLKLPHEISQLIILLLLLISGKLNSYIYFYFVLYLGLPFSAREALLSSAVGGTIQILAVVVTVYS